MNIVIKSNPKEISAIKDHYKKYLVPPKNPYVSFMAKMPGLVVTAYTSHKLMFQGSLADQAVTSLGLHKTTGAKAVKSSGGAVRPKSNTQAHSQANIIGTDEVGNGSYFGGLAVVASYVAERDVPELKRLGVDDSKNLKDQQILRLAPILEGMLKHTSILLSPSKYNQAIDAGYNAVSIKVHLHNQAIFLLEKKLADDDHINQLVIDAFTTPNNYQKYARKERNHPQTEPSLIQKAEGQFLAVAASSIIARSLFLKNLRDLSDDLSLGLPSGAGSKSDLVAAQIITQKGMATLEKTAKMHFKNTEKAKKLAGLK
ncbi:ribonuclease HIII [Streptococcaceae bacterium ESL0729]|nr:ribonuclease HIII [Streptococcaceae bacterium ESL0729]